MWNDRASPFPICSGCGEPPESCVKCVVAAVDNGLLIRDQSMNITVREFVCSVLPFEEGEPSQPHNCSDKLRAEIQCSECGRHLEVSDRCPDHPERPLSLCIDDSLLNLKVKDFLDSIKDLNSYEETVIVLLFEVFDYTVRRQQGLVFSPLEAAQALALAEAVSGTTAPAQSNPPASS